MSPIRMERLESATRVVVAFIKAFNQHDVAMMMQLVSEYSTLEAPSPAPDGMMITGKEAITLYWTDFFQRHHEAHLKVEESMGYGMRCILRWQRDWVDETGNKLHLRGMDIFRVQDGLITEVLSYVKG
jgi:predicted SnoaL-like aldol condensation-catalyzing enzyme